MNCVDTIKSNEELPLLYIECENQSDAIKLSQCISVQLGFLFWSHKVVDGILKHKIITGDGFMRGYEKVEGYENILTFNDFNYKNDKLNNICVERFKSKRPASVFNGKKFVSTENVMFMIIISPRKPRHFFEMATENYNCLHPCVDYYFKLDKIDGMGLCSFDRVLGKYELCGDYHWYDYHLFMQYTCFIYQKYRTMVGGGYDIPCIICSKKKIKLQGIEYHYCTHQCIDTVEVNK